MVLRTWILKTTAIIFLFTLTVNCPAMAGKEAKLRTIYLEGSYFEIGEKWGKETKEELKAVFDNEIAGLSQFLGVPPKDMVALAGKYIPVVEEYDPEFIEVLKGMAKGSGLAFEELFSLRTLLELMFYANQLPAMCTSFAVSGEASADGQTIIGQNIDWHSGIPLSVLNIRWPNGVNQLCLSLGGIWEYPLSYHPDSSAFGMVANLTVSMKEGQDIKTLPTSIIMSKAARQKRLDMALSVVVNGQQNMAGYILANSQGEMVGIESAANSYEVLFPEDDIIVRSNHYLTDRFKPLDFFAPYSPDSYLRYHRIKRLIQADSGKITPELMMKKLADHNNFPKSICMHVDHESPYPPSETLASIIMIPDKKIVYIAPGNPCETEYVKYQMD